MAVVVVTLASACADDGGPESLPPLSAEEPGSESASDPEPESASEPAGDEATSTTEDATTTEATASDETAPSEADVPMPGDDGFDEYIADRVEAYYEVLNAASAAPSADPESDYPELSELAADNQLQVSYNAIRELHAEGQAYREIEDAEIGTSIEDEHRVSPVISVEGDVVTIFDCEVDDDDVIDIESGEIVIEGTLTILTVVTLTFIDGDWKVTGTEVSQKLEGVGGCYLASEAEFPF